MTLAQQAITARDDRPALGAQCYAEKANWRDDSAQASHSARSRGANGGR